MTMRWASRARFSRRLPDWVSIERMADEPWNQVGVTARQLISILAAAEDVDSDSVLLRTPKGDSDPTTVEVWLFSEEAEGMVGMISVDTTGYVTELDE